MQQLYIVTDVYTGDDGKKHSQDVIFDDYNSALKEMGRILTMNEKYHDGAVSWRTMWD